MIEHKAVPSLVGLLLLGAGAAAHRAGASQDVAMPSLAPATFARIGTVDERFQSYNVEMLEVTGGRFWKPYNAPASPPPPPGSSPVGEVGADRYAYRPPKDLGNHRLRALADAL